MQREGDAVVARSEKPPSIKTLLGTLLGFAGLTILAALPIAVAVAQGQDIPWFAWLGPIVFGFFLVAGIWVYLHIRKGEP
jgi:hypothetical protein